jgi:CRP-like cAMP-binding protein
VGRDSDGGEILLAHLGPGDVVGEMGVVLRRPASADVRVVHPTVVLELTREAFAEAIASHPELLFELYDLATKRDEVTRSVVAQQTLDVDEVVLL